LQVALNGGLLRVRHKTEIEQLLFTIRKCLIELDSLSSKTKAFLIMTLDLYYNNFANVGDGLEKMYQTFLVDDIKVVTKPAVVEEIKKPKAPESKKVQSPAERLPERRKVQSPVERVPIAKRSEGPRRSSSTPRNSTAPNRRSEPFRNGPAASMTNGYGSSSRQEQKVPPRLNLKTPPPSRSMYEAPRRFASQSPSRYPPQSPKKKLSPQDLRNKKSFSSAYDMTSTKQSPTKASKAPPMRAERPKVQSTKSLDLEPTPPTPEPTNQNGNDDNILRQQNSRSSTPSSTTPVKLKASNKVYFREENVENLTWNGETSFDGDNDDPDASTSPKVNPYSSSFLNFLSSN
jgi:hypothetical protein